MCDQPRRSSYRALARPVVWHRHRAQRLAHQRGGRELLDAQQNRSSAASKTQKVAPRFGEGTGSLPPEPPGEDARVPGRSARGTDSSLGELEAYVTASCGCRIYIVTHVPAPA